MVVLIRPGAHGKQRPGQSHARQTAAAASHAVRSKLLHGTPRVKNIPPVLFLDRDCLADYPEAQLIGIRPPKPKTREDRWNRANMK